MSPSVINRNFPVNGHRHTEGQTESSLQTYTSQVINTSIAGCRAPAPFHAEPERFTLADAPRLMRQLPRRDSRAPEASLSQTLPMPGAPPGNNAGRQFEQRH